MLFYDDVEEYSGDDAEGGVRKTQSVRSSILATRVAAAARDQKSWDGLRAIIAGAMVVVRRVRPPLAPRCCDHVVLGTSADRCRPAAGARSSCDAIPSREL